MFSTVQCPVSARHQCLDNRIVKPDTKHSMTSHAFTTLKAFRHMVSATVHCVPIHTTRVQEHSSQAQTETQNSIASGTLQSLQLHYQFSMLRYHPLASAFQLCLSHTQTAILIRTGDPRHIHSIIARHPRSASPHTPTPFPRITMYSTPAEAKQGRHRSPGPTRNPITASRPGSRNHISQVQWESETSEKEKGCQEAAPGAQAEACSVRNHPWFSTRRPGIYHLSSTR